MQISPPNNVYAGLDANKSANPRTGIIYFALDTQKTYQCFIAGSWTLVNSLTSINIFDHTGAATNELSTHVTGSGTATTDSFGHNMKLATGLTNLSKAKYGTAMGFLPTTYTLYGVIKLKSAVTLGTAPAGVPNVFKAGFVYSEDGLNTSIQSTFTVDSESGQWKCVTQTAQELTITNITAPSRTSLLVVIVVNIGDMRYTIYRVDEAVVATHTLIGSYGLDLYFEAYVKALGTPTAEMNVRIDYIGLKALL